MHREYTEAATLAGASREDHVLRLRAANPPSGALTRCVPADADQVPVIRRAVSAFAAGHGAGSTAQADIALAISEACTNVVLHAYVDAPKSGPMTVDAHCDSGELVVVVRDEGRGMMPRADSPGLGLGLSIIRQLTRRLDLSDHNLTPGTTVRMSFALTAETV